MYAVNSNELQPVCQTMVKRDIPVVSFYEIMILTVLYGIQAKTGFSQYIPRVHGKGHVRWPDGMVSPT